MTATWSYEGGGRGDPLRRGAVQAGLGVDVQVRSQARVYLAYAEKFGIPCPPLRRLHGLPSTTSWSRASCLGLRQQVVAFIECLRALRLP